MLRRGEKQQSGDTVTPEEEIKDPYVLEFLGLKDEYVPKRTPRSLATPSRGSRTSSSQLSTERRYRRRARWSRRSRKRFIVEPTALAK